MAAGTELFWRLLPDVRFGERSRFLLFAGLFTLISLAQTIGLVGTEALFLARLGAARLPAAFIAASIFTVLGSIVYAVRVGEARNDTLFSQMLIGAGVVLAGCAVGASYGVVWVLPGLFCLFYLTQAVFINHFWTFSGDYFDTHASKRLFPIFAIGASLGGVLGGGIAVLLTGLVGPASLIGVWGILLAASALLLQLAHRPLRRWGPLDLEEADETSVENIQGSLRYLGTSSLARWLVVSAIGMVVTFSFAQYLYSDIFARSIPDPSQLAVFFGLYLALTNVIEILLEAFVTPWLIRRVGVPSANLIHPLLTLVSFGGLAFHYALPTGIFARMNRELTDNAMALPIRSLLVNAMPPRLHGRMRAFLEGIVVYAGMSLAGLLLIAVGDPDPVWLCAAGGVAALVYLGANWRVRRAYLDTLVNQLRAGRLDLAELSGELGNWEAARLAQLWEQLLREERDRPSRSLLQLIPSLAGRGITDPLVRAASHPNAEVRRASVNALATVGGQRVEGPLALALDDPHPGVRLAALRGLSRRRGDPGFAAQRLRDLVDDPDPEVRAEAALCVGDEGVAVLDAMLRSAKPVEIAAALAVAPAVLRDAVLALAEDSDPGIRAAALECIARTIPDALPDEDELLEALADPDSRVRRAAVLLLANRDDPKALESIAGALADTSAEVQFAAESVLVSLGEKGLEVAELHFDADQERAIERALRVVAAIGTGRAREHLARALRRRTVGLFNQVIAYQHLPHEESLTARFLRVACADSMMRHRRLAFRILELLETTRVIKRVERALRQGKARSHGDALVVLENLGDREAAQLLVAVHEAGSLEERTRTVARLVTIPERFEEVLDAFRRSDSRWLRMAAEAYAARDGGPPPEETTMERLLALKQVPLFAELGLEQLDALQQLTKEVNYLPNEVIVREGDPGGELYLLVEGSVRVFKDYGRPIQTTLRTLPAVSYFGEMAILDDGTRAATVVAYSRARLLSLDGANLKELIQQMPEISFDLLRVLTTRVRDGERRLSETESRLSEMESRLREMGR